VAQETSTADGQGGRDLRVAVIGAGMAGILAAVRLEEDGIDVEIFEKADRVGGTWRDNTYPGLSCDVPAHVYTYAFARNPGWSHFYAPGAEIQAYFQSVADRYGITPRIRFGDEVTELRFRDGGWDLATASGHRDRFDAVVAATGVLHHPNIPDIPGLDRFEGAWFHTARWNHEVPLDDRRVGLVGTGSTAVQIVSALVDRVRTLTLFQRSAQWVMQSDNKTYTEADRARYAERPEALEASIERMKRTIREGISAAVIDADSPQLAQIDELCRANLDTVVDPVLREKLRPDYRAACKRLIFSPDFYDKIQRPNADVVTDRIVEVEPTGVRTADGTLHELDVLVLATGFAVDRFVRPVHVIGRDGIDLDTLWADGPVAHLSVTVPHLPNFFMLNGPNGPVGNFSLIDVADAQLGHVRALLGLLRSGAVRQVSPTPEALADFEEERRAAAARTVWATGCRSWYLDRTGVPATWTFSWERFRDEMGSVDLAEFDLR